MTKTLKRSFWVAAAGALATLGAACGSTSSTGAASPSTTAPPGSVATTPTTSPPGGGSSSLRVYFMRGDKLAVAARTVPATRAVATAAVNELLAGPTTAEASSGLSTSIPSGTTLRGISIAKGTATTDLSALYASGGGSLSMMARLAQVVYTLTQFPTVSQVVFRLDGQPVTVFGGEGIVLDQPASRSGFESVTPAVLIEGPTPGEQARSPLRVWGTADVFEAVFNLELRDSNGRVLATQRVQATSGTGTRGSFDVSVPFPAASGQARLTAFVLSPEDGSRHDVASITVEIGR